MTILHIEHPVPNFEGWKKAFESDPIDRKSMGVKSYKLYRSVSNPNYVAIDLAFDELSNAEKTLAKLQGLWSQVEGKVMTGPKTHIFDLIDATDL